MVNSPILASASRRPGSGGDAVCWSLPSSSSAAARSSSGRPSSRVRTARTRSVTPRPLTALREGGVRGEGREELVGKWSASMLRSKRRARAADAGLPNHPTQPPAQARVPDGKDGVGRHPLCRQLLPHILPVVARVGDVHFVVGHKLHGWVGRRRGAGG